MNLPMDIFYNLRLLQKNAGFVAICVLMIGMGMGLSITLYSIVSNMSPSPLPITNGDRFVTVYAVDKSSGEFQGKLTDGYIYHHLQQTAHSFSTLGAYWDARATLSDGDIAQEFQADRITSNLLQVASVAPILGRNLQPSDDVPGAEPVVLISYQLWQRYYAGRQDIIGTIGRIDGEPYTIVGVMPEGFSYPIWSDLWLPLQIPAAVEPGEWRQIRMLAVLDDKVNVTIADGEVNALLQQLSDDLPVFYGSWRGTVRQCCSIFNNKDGEPSAGPLLPSLTIALLLLVCLNVANLILVRTNERIQEFSIRSALGASRRELILAILQDSLLICVLGSVLGLILANVGMSYADNALSEAIAPQSQPFWFSFDWRLNTVTAAVCIVLAIWLLSAALAVWQVSRRDLSVTMASSKVGATNHHGLAGTAVVVSVEMIFSCFLLIISGTFIGATSDSADADYGTATNGYLTGRIELGSSYPDEISQRIYRDNLRRELLVQEGITEVSFTTALPSQYGEQLSYSLNDRDIRVDNEYPTQTVVHIATNYFDTMAVKLRAGRNFDSTDTANSLLVVIVDELLAQKLWPDDPNPVRAALGKRIQINPERENAQWLTIVGVTPHIVQRMASDGLYEPSLYRPFSQYCCTKGRQSFSIVLKVVGDPDSYRQILQRTAATVDRDVAVAEMFTLAEILDKANSVVTFAAEMSSIMALITLLLAVTGIFAIISRSVHQRSKEIGIRRAIGSSNRNAVAIFVLQGFKYLSLGLLVGGGGAVLTANVLSYESIGLINWLPTVFACVTVMLGLLVFTATFAPARQLVALEPGDMLRDE